MTKKKSFKAKLSKKELEHFADMSDHGRVTLTALRAALAHQKEKGITCHECRALARKLNILEED